MKLKPAGILTSNGPIVTRDNNNNNNKYTQRYSIYNFIYKLSFQLITRVLYNKGFKRVAKKQSFKFVFWLVAKKIKAKIVSYLRINLIQRIMYRNSGCNLLLAPSPKECWCGCEETQILRNKGIDHDSNTKGEKSLESQCKYRFTDFIPTKVFTSYSSINS